MDPSRCFPSCGHAASRCPSLSLLPCLRYHLHVRRLFPFQCVAHSLVQSRTYEGTRCVLPATTLVTLRRRNIDMRYWDQPVRKATRNRPGNWGTVMMTWADAVRTTRLCTIFRQFTQLEPRHPVSDDQTVAVPIKSSGAGQYLPSCTDVLFCYKPYIHAFYSGRW